MYSTNEFAIGIVTVHYISKKQQNDEICFQKQQKFEKYAQNVKQTGEFPVVEDRLKADGCRKSRGRDRRHNESGSTAEKKKITSHRQMATT